jgi:hypothetical protein
MTTVALRPTSDFANFGFSPYPALPATHYDKVYEAICDNDTTYVHRDVSGVDGYSYYNFADRAGVEVITQLRIYIVCRSENDAARGHCYTGIRFTGSGHEYYGADQQPSTAYTIYHTDYNADPDIGGAWTWAAVNALVGGVLGRAGTDLKSDYPIRCTQYWIEVDYVGPTTAYKDIATRFKLTVQNYKDIATRFKLTVRNYTDIPTRFKLIVRSYTDIATRFKLIIRNYTDIATRFILQVQGYRDIATRFLLHALGYRDINTRFRLVGQGHCDTATRFYLIAQPPLWHEWMFESDDYILQGRPQAAHFRL